jgi:hypothetical protein
MRAARWARALLWELLCGPNEIFTTDPSRSPTSAADAPTGGCFAGGGGGGGGGGAFLGSCTVVATNSTHPCAEKAFKAILQCALKFIPLRTG